MATVESRYPNLAPVYKKVRPLAWGFYGKISQVQLVDAVSTSDFPQIAVLKERVLLGEDAESQIDQLETLLCETTGLKHPNLVVPWWFVDSGHPPLRHLQIYMEYCPGGRLADKVEEGLSYTEIVDYTRQVALGLQFLHNKNIILKVLTPENVLLADFHPKGTYTTAKIGSVDTACILKADKSNKPFPVEIPEINFRYTPPEMRQDEKNLWFEKESLSGINIWQFGILIHDIMFDCECLVDSSNNWDPEMNRSAPSIPRNATCPEDRFSTFRTGNIKCFRDDDPEHPVIHENTCGIFRAFLAHCLAEDPKLRHSADLLVENEFLRYGPSLAVALRSSNYDWKCFSCFGCGHPDGGRHLPGFPTNHLMLEFFHPPQQYRKEKLLGHGSFGFVYFGKLASFPPGFHPTEMAIKILKHEFRKQFVTEKLEKIMTLSHRNVVILHTFTTLAATHLEPERLALAMEFCSGGNLKTRRNTEGLCYTEVVDYTRQIVNGLIFLHSNSIVHMDLKPENVLLTEYHYAGFYRTAKIGDLDNPVLLTHSESGLSDTIAPGSERYYSPEMRARLNEVLARTVVGRATDIWSLGYLIHDIIFGTEKCNVILSSDGTQSLQNNGPSSISGQLVCVGPEGDFIKHTVCDTLSSFLGGCLVKDPKKRQTAQELSEKNFLCGGPSLEVLLDAYPDYVWSCGFCAGHPDGGRHSTGFTTV